MRKIMSTLTIAVLVVVMGSFSQAADEPELFNSYWCRRELLSSNSQRSLIRLDTMMGPRGRGGGSSGFGGTNSPLAFLYPQIDDLVRDKDKLVQAVAESRRMPQAKVRFVNPENWEAETAQNKSSELFLVSITPFNEGQAFVVNNYIAYSLKFSSGLKRKEADAIVDRYNDLWVGPARNVIQKFFSDRFDPIFADAQKAKDLASGQLEQLESEHRGLEIRAADQLSYEKATDALADVLRQQLAIELSLAGMDAKRDEIEKQKRLIDLRVRDRAEKAEKEVAASETVDALKQLIALREKNIERLKEANKAGLIAGQGEIDEATAKLLETKIQLYALQGKKHAPVQNDQLDGLDAELTRLAIDRSEQRARLEYLAKRRDEWRDVISQRAKLDQDIKHIDEQLPAAKTAFRNADRRVKELEDAKATFKPIDLSIDEG